MDVRKFFFLIILLFHSACAPSKQRGQTTFENPSPHCQSLVVPNEFVIKKHDGSLSLEKNRSVDSLMADENIEKIEPNYRIHLDVVHSAATDSRSAAAMANINVEGAWQEGLYGQNVVVAVIDSGVDLNHPLLADRIVINEQELRGRPNFDDDRNGKVDDIHGWNFALQSDDLTDGVGHGTHVSGIILAEHTDDVSDPRGVAPQAKLLPISFLDRNGNGQIYDAIFALDYARERGAKVVNASWGGAGCSVFLRDKINALADAGVLFVAAAGNAGRNVDQMLEYPASFNLPNQITVGASTQDNFLANFSNYGIRNVHIVAPGVDILSTFPTGSTTLMSGTSMSAPFVTGAVALLASAFPQASYLEIKQALLNTASIANYPVSSRGRLNIMSAVNQLRR